MNRAVLLAVLGIGCADVTAPEPDRPMTHYATQERLYGEDR